MRQQITDKKFSGWQEGLLAAMLTGVPAVLLLTSVPGRQGSSAALMVTSAVSGALLLMATLTFYLRWLDNPHPALGWIASAMMVLSFQLLLCSGLGLVDPAIWTGALRWVSPADLVVTAAALLLLVLAARGVRAPDPLLLGLCLGFGVGALQVTELLASPLAPPSRILDVIMLLTILCGHAAVAHLMWRERALPRWARARLVVTVCLIGCTYVARSGFLDTRATDVVAAVALSAAAALWTSATFVLLRETLHDQHLRSATLEGSLLEIETSWRGSREQLHEIRSTLAGAVCASRLLSDNELSAETHAQLERSIRAELDRLERLVSDQPPVAAGPVDVDATIDVLLASHRARGRAITWEPTGSTVHARPDDVAEALNILIDNAATHGGAASTIAVTDDDGLVEIAVSDEGPGVPIERREQIFEWGVRAGESQGQGIGLNLARRLVVEQGGSLSLAEPRSAGSSFVIRLPAARRSEASRDRGTEPAA